MSDLDTDHLYAGDKWTLPLGRAVVAAADILDVDSVEEIDQDANGEYIARIGDVIYARPEEYPAVRNETFYFPSVTLGTVTGGVSPGAVIDIPLSATNLDVGGNQYVLRLDRAEFNTSTTSSLMRITMNLSDLTVSSGTARLDVGLPAGFEVEVALLPSGVTASGRTLNWQLDIGGRPAADVQLPLRS
ncbi:MAG: hypothetical protein LUE10_08915 [Alistipes sp.]|nr:hypothetical protein [Alistipes sp.]